MSSTLMYGVLGFGGFGVITAVVVGTYRRIRDRKAESPEDERLFGV